MLEHGLTPDEAYKPFVGKTPLFLPYRDAGYGSATYLITILDCLKGIHKAIELGLFSFQDFNLEEYVPSPF
jgi:cell division cycle 14